MKYLFGIIAILILQHSITFAQSKADDVIGNWQTSSKEPAKVQIFKSEEKYYGKIFGIKTPLNDKGNPKADINNPDKNKRSNPIVGLLILKDFKFDGKNEWTEGTVYDPESGKTYSAYFYLSDINTLKVRGYVGFAALGRTETWTRIK
ncbi:MAG: DUF2147 domain-containing protein [Ignavibacteria bacterium]|nr:DUF2147 domain-containing protein [Ignavibacteria bacterium]